MLWVLPDSIKLLNSFSIVLIFYTTYKTNKYHLPLLKIVSITSTNMTFVVASTYFNSERTNNFEWALSKMKGLFVKDDVLSQLIVTDMDLVLMNAFETLFPSLTNLLCLFYITKNVNAKCKIHVYKDEE